MEARIKKIFHRKRDDDSLEPSVNEDDVSQEGNTSSSLRTSLYDLTVPREPPRTGTLPLQGNSTRSSPNHISAISASGSSHLSPRSPRYGSDQSSAILSSERDQQSVARLLEKRDGRQKKLPEIPTSPLPPSLNVDDEVCQFLPTALDAITNSSEAIRSSMQTSQNQATPPGRPRKAPAAWAGTTRSDHPSSSIGSSVYEPRSLIPGATGVEEAQDGARARATSSRRPIAKTSGAVDVAEEILEKARSNSTHTDITETIAPAVVHETIREEVHEIRQELITREIHNHDYYHRILPIVDVEVLPARHFLPVEGGGLVEISRDEVPGRGRQWVVAETASRTRSDQPVPPAISRFSAREFVGSEGEFKRYTTPEGFERTEETWVHPPELETGGRDTGQTRPLELRGEVNQMIRSRPGSSSMGQPEKPPVNRLSPV